MQNSLSGRGKILITGGTSGLGLELVRLFLSKGFYVVATGRQQIDLPGFETRFRLYLVDFSNLRETAAVIKNIFKTTDFDHIIYNAGILSPPCFTTTADGYEYTYQVNFLAHFLINEIITRMHDPCKPLKIAAVTSTVYRIGAHDLKFIQGCSDYKPLKAYSDSKLCLALMCRRLASRYNSANISFLTFDPGIFGSRIYRMQSRFFGILYNIAAPFMRKPSSVARTLAGVLIEYNFISGEIYDRRKRIRKLTEIESSVSEAFWKETSQKISPYLD